MIVKRKVSVIEMATAKDIVLRTETVVEKSGKTWQMFERKILRPGAGGMWGDCVPGIVAVQVDQDWLTRPLATDI